MWFEVFEPHRTAELRTQGMHVDKQTTLVDGDIATLFRLTAEDALADPYRRFCTLFSPPALLSVCVRRADAVGICAHGLFRRRGIGPITRVHGCGQEALEVDLP